MRIVMVNQHFLVSGIGSTRPYDLARYLGQAGHDVTVICGKGYLSQSMDLPSGLINRLNIDGINLLCLGVDYRQGMGFFRRIVSFLMFTFLAMITVCFLPRHDVLMASSTPLTVGLTGLVWRYARRRPWVFEIRDLWPEVPAEAGFLRSRFLFHLCTFFEEWFYREAAEICAISKPMCDRLVERGVPADKLHFLPTGVNLHRYDREPDQDFRKKHNLENHWTAVYVGTHGPVNGLDYLLDAAESLRDQSDIRLVLIGEGSQKARLVAEAERRGLLGNPLLFLPPVPQKEIPGILLSCDAMLMINSSLPGMQYLMSSKFYDYLASGRPLIINVQAAVTDWITRADCGLLCDPSRPEDFARVAGELRSNPLRAEQMGKNAKKLARTHFDRTRLNEQWEHVLAMACE